MAIHELAGRPAPAGLLIDVPALLEEYFARIPDPGDARQRVSFGTSGHRGSASEGTFNELHIEAIAQAICEYRGRKGIEGPLFLGRDTHALSAPAEETALRVLVANGVTVRVPAGGGFTPTPVISHAVLAANRDPAAPRADGIVITPSHNPPRDGGFKYNPPEGGPADSEVTGWIEDRANELLGEGNRGVRKAEAGAIRKAVEEDDFGGRYIEDLSAVLDLEAIREARVRMGVDPLGGAAAAFWGPIAKRFGLDIQVVNPSVDPTFRFMPVDHDGRIRMDCSSPWAMAGLLRLKDDFQVAFGNDPDADRHGIVTPSAGLMDPNHYLAVAIHYLLTHRPDWPEGAAVGKTLVSSGLIDRVVAGLGRSLCEVPVGFKWLAPGLFDSSFCFGGEESAGASFLRRNGAVWTTDKDGITLALLAGEITAVTGKEPGEYYRDLVERFGEPFYRRVDTPASPEEKEKLLALSPKQVTAGELAGEPILAKLVDAPGNGAPIGGLKVVAENGWFAARPSGTEDINKIYAESFRSPEHLEAILAEARRIVAAT